MRCQSLIASIGSGSFWWTNSFNLITAINPCVLIHLKQNTWFWYHLEEQCPKKETSWAKAASNNFLVYKDEGEWRCFTQHLPIYYFCKETQEDPAPSGGRATSGYRSSDPAATGEALAGGDRGAVSGGDKGTSGNDLGEFFFFFGGGGDWGWVLLRKIKLFGLEK